VNLAIGLGRRPWRSFQFKSWPAQPALARPRLPAGARLLHIVGLSAALTGAYSAPFKIIARSRLADAATCNASAAIPAAGP